MILSQVEAASKAVKRQRRWDKLIISECLNLYTRSPQGYISLRDSGILILPSPHLLILYKGLVHQEPGFKADIFTWMAKEADKLDVSTQGRIGGILLDEMSIQEVIEIVRSGDDLELVGFVDMGQEREHTRALKEGVHKQIIGTHVLQLMFQGITGFRFPFAHFVNRQVSASDLYVLVWEAVNMLYQYGFDIKYVSMDGAKSNRSF